MAITVSKRGLSGATDSLPIDVSSTAGGSTTLHAGPTSSTTTFDEIFLYATNSSTAFVTLSLIWGATTDQMDYEIPGKANFYPLITGQFIGGVSAGNTATTLKAHASDSQTISIYGNVNRIVES